MEKLLAIITIAQRVGGKRLLLKLFSRLMVVFGLVITTAILVSATLVGGLIAAHDALLGGGMSPPLALLSAAGAALLIIATLITVIVCQLGRLRRLPKTSPLMDALDAFTDGLMAD